ncbi:putative ATP-binding protein involved in virulence [Chitinophaga dinghuensis]|uniref:Putative ATP-binding protein involved in virulence n=1 Tax=Chitinophaga dinghuensis TaxID=1539050 RepID=A0A327VTA5_9BACT|nr:ATP-binding protein [Chitinophaga dinghuensis]RAJ79291.1 putative ATP-binding protein involved in virulence [Chitinophaga dinghuensis]
MIRSLVFRNKEYRFINTASYQEPHNAFTVLVGKNGTGKSTLLSALVNRLAPEYSEEDKAILIDNITLPFLVAENLDNVIAVSSSPFDKFPIVSRYKNLTRGKYRYLGLRDGNGQNLGLSYMAKIISDLIDSIQRDNAQWSNLSEVLSYLDFKNEIVVKLQCNISRALIESIIEEGVYPPMLFNDRQRSDLIVEALRTIYGKEKARTQSMNIFLDINEMGINAYNRKTVFNSEQIITLMKVGILTLKDVALVKNGQNTLFSIKDSSSGEQSVILSVLGIASHITNNSVIFIDEPEVCLHPEWQQKYIQMLLSTFKKFTGCHFIIATHSPQIIAKLESENCYVVSMDTASITDAAELINNSVDFQLAQVFKSPGFKNEYLSRLAFNLFVKVGKHKQFDEEDLANYQVLKSSHKLLEDADPVKELITVILSLHKRYA